MEADGDEGIASDAKARLIEAWKVNNVAATCGVLLDEILSRCVQWLLGQFGCQGLSFEDCEDCFNDGVEGLLKRNSSQVSDPYNYLFTSAKNAALDILRERYSTVRYDPERQGDDDDSPDDWIETPQSGKSMWSPETMFIVAEAALDLELTAREEQLRVVFQTTLPKLAPGRRLLLKVLLELGATTSNAVLANIMGRSETAIKSLKSRTFDDLRTLLPMSAYESGMDFDRILAAEPEAWVRIPTIPSEEDDFNPMP